MSNLDPLSEISQTASRLNVLRKSIVSPGINAVIIVAMTKSRVIGAANQMHAWAAAQGHPGQAIHAWAGSHNARQAIGEAHDALMHFLASE